MTTGALVRIGEVTLVAVEQVSPGVWRLHWPATGEYSRTAREDEMRVIG